MESSSMSSTTPVTTPSSGGLSRDTIIIIAVCCPILGICLIAVCLRLLIPRIRRKKKKPESEDRSLFHSTQSLANTENQFYYAGPVPPPREGFAKSKAGDSQAVPTISGREDLTDVPSRSYRRISEEFRNSTAWVSGQRQIDTFHAEIPESISEQVPESTHFNDQPDLEDNMRSEYPRDDSSHLHRHNVSHLYRSSDFRKPQGPRAQRHIQREVIREDVPPLVRPHTNYRENTGIQRTVIEENSIYSAPANPPRKVVAPRGNNPGGERRAMPTTERELRPVPYVRSPVSESPRVTQDENHGSPTWVKHALMIQNPLSWRAKDSPLVQNSNKIPNGHSNVNTGQPNAPRQLSATEYLHKSQYSGNERQYVSGDRHHVRNDIHNVIGNGQYVGNDRQYTGNDPAHGFAQGRQYVGAGTREFTQVNRDVDQYGHYVNRPGPGTRSIYSLGKDAIRTPELREYVRDGRQWRGMNSRDVYGQSASASDRGDYRSSRAVEYSYGGTASTGALAPVRDELAPSHLPEEYYGRGRTRSLTAEQLNSNLTSYLGTGLAMKPLDMSERYRENWDNQFDPNHQRDGALSHHAHPSENRSPPSDLVMLHLNTPAQTGYRPAHQNLPQTKEGKKGKKKKGKSK